MKVTTAKERILKQIRKALLEKHDNPYINLEESPLYPDFEDPLEITFAKQFTAVSGKFVFCEDELDFAEKLISLAEQESLRKIYVWEKALQQLLGKFGFPFYASDTSFEDAQAGITLCEALIARNGSVLISNKSHAGRRLSIYPNFHIVLAYTSQLVPDIKDGLLKIKSKYEGNIPSMLSVITGPSRTADIEKTLVLGAHGPKELYVFLIDDSIMPSSSSD